MTAKPFPFPIGIGIDVCQVSRIAAVLRHEHTRNRWARKIFTRLEWPALCRKLQRIRNSTGEPAGQDDEADEQKIENEGQAVVKGHDDTIWMLPSLSGYSSISHDKDSYYSAIGDERSVLGGLARHLAGRWAAKEAVIKAHRHRRLYSHDISIVTSAAEPDSLDDGMVRSGSVYALIDPPCDRIGMNTRVATRRGLRGFSPKSFGLHKAALMTREELRKKPLVSQGSEEHQEVHCFRKSHVKTSDRQVAKVSISHDGDYAVASCMAVDPQWSTVPEKTIVDNGEGPSLHEPEWGDEGWPVSANSGFEQAPLRGG